MIIFDDFMTKSALFEIFIFFKTNLANKRILFGALIRLIALFMIVIFATCAFDDVGLFICWITYFAYFKFLDDVVSHLEYALCMIDNKKAMYFGK